MWAVHENKSTYYNHYIKSPPQRFSFLSENIFYISRHNWRAQSTFPVKLGIRHSKPQICWHSFAGLHSRWYLHVTLYIRQTTHFPDKQLTVLIMHQSFENPRTPPSGLSWAFTFYASESEWVKSPVPGEKGEWCIPPPLSVQHMALSPFVKQLIIAKCNVHWLKDTDQWQP